MKNKLIILLLLLSITSVHAQESKLTWVTNETVIHITGVSTNNLPRSLVIPNRIETLRVTEIKSYAFQNIGRFTNVTIGLNVTNIQRGAFKKCTNLGEVIFMGSPNLERGAFHNCTKLETIKMIAATNDIRRGHSMRKKPLILTDANTNTVNIIPAETNLFATKKFSDNTKNIRPRPKGVPTAW